ncbi:equilibrative nucleotide transporter 3 [Artemisia annua]|uniref:Equilibrative nucleotide transporter 3 n=1 Tax=Artemisia annua TaxID=35608 RepID=A0A2U1PFR1_ARTAN|nr:equilibrative nucleotide transporter 3 [Artemisia annua]
MTIVYSGDETPLEIKGKWSAVVMCWIFGLGTVLSWNIISTLGDYFYEVFRYPLVLVTTYNVSNLAVRYVPLIKVLKMESRKGITILVLSRFLFIPLFYFTSKYGDQGWMIVLVFFLGVTTGYPITCIMTLAPQSYMGPERYALGNVLVLSLQIGCLI